MPVSRRPLVQCHGPRPAGQLPWTLGPRAESEAREPSTGSKWVDGGVGLSSHGRNGDGCMQAPQSNMWHNLQCSIFNLQQVLLSKRTANIICRCRVSTAYLSAYNFQFPLICTCKGTLTCTKNILLYFVHFHGPPSLATSSSSAAASTVPTVSAVPLDVRTIKAPPKRQNDRSKAQRCQRAPRKAPSTCFLHNTSRHRPPAPPQLPLAPATAPIVNASGGAQKALARDQLPHHTLLSPSP